MSRHKLVKTLNLDDELDDYDGGGNYDQVEDQRDEARLSSEDKEQLQIGTAKVRSILGSEVAVTDGEIQDSLWHYYYDVTKTVNYILSAAASTVHRRVVSNSLALAQKSSESKKTKKKESASKGKVANGLLVPWHTPIRPQSCCSVLSAAEFFKDSPWLNIPKDRRGEILVEPLYPRGRLFGGAPSQGGKVSKLAALAAARKKKEQEKNQIHPSQNSNTSVALLDKLGRKASAQRPCEDDAQLNPKPPASDNVSAEQVLRAQDLAYPSRKRKNSSTLSQSEQDTQDPKTLLPSSSSLYEQKPLRAAPIAAPSMFARAMFGMSNALEEPSNKRPKKMIFTLPQGPVSYAEINPFAGPSPDDIVKAAQNSKGLKPNKAIPQPQNGDNSVKAVTQGVEDVTLEDTPKAKSKNLNVIAEFEKLNTKNAASFVVIGHVDAGKSTLMGRLLYDLKVVDQRTIDKYKKEAESIGKSSFALAWVLDQGTEERTRGVTIDIATNKFETEKTTFTILDAPGHRDFIPNMIAGASQADFAVLVIDASTGSFESGLKGQTKEHALLVRSMGVARLIVAINKLDTVNWSQDRFSEISIQLSAFLAAAGFLTRNVSFVPCSGLTGENIVQPSQSPLLTSWYQGPSLLDLLDASEPIARALGKPLRLTINDIFRGSITHPLSVSGRLDSGSIQTGDIILAMPSSETALVKAIEVDSEPADWAVAGQNTTLHLADIEAKFLKPGDIICTLKDPIKNISTLTTKVLAFSHVMPMHVEVHRGRLHTPGRITQLVALLDKGSGATIKKHPRLVKPGSVAKLVVELEEAVPLEAPARVILRTGGETVAAGLLE